MSQIKKIRALIPTALAAFLSFSLAISSITNGDEVNDASSASSFHVQSSPHYLPTDSKLNAVEYASIDELRSRFQSPGVDFATGPLWVWNDLLTEEQVRSTLADLNAQHVDQAFVHPRPGLATPYLSDDWFKLWGAALDEAQKRGMKIWIYDENSYPSGFGGGLVPDSMPESRGLGLDVLLLDDLVDASGAWALGDSVVYVVEMRKNGDCIDRTKEILAARKVGEPLPQKAENFDKWAIGRIQYAGRSQWTAGKTYVNLITKGVLDRFIGITHEQYRRHFGDQFGKLIPGAFTDEPQVASAGMFSWAEDFPEEFAKRRGYDLIPRLGSLVAPVGDWKQTRYDYYKTVLELFIERWHKPFAEYCESVGLQYTGHDWEHEWPNAHHVPDNMATAFWRQRPAVDLLMNQFSRTTHSQFGNVRAVRELNSAARQAGRCRTLSENYGAGGYDIRFSDLKRLGDWSFAMGVNTSDEHLSYISIRGARKHDHPQTFSYHSPWFEQYSKLEDYWTRLSFILSRGTLSDERFLLLEPTSTVWLYQNDSGADNGKKDIVANVFTNLVNKLEEEQVDYDLGSEDIIGRVGSVSKNEFVVGAARYRTVALPPLLENLDEKTVRLLATFVGNGGRLIALDSSLNLVGGRPLESLKKAKPMVAVDLENVKKGVEHQTIDDLIVETRREQPVVVLPSSNAENLFHQIRENKDSLILFVCNIDPNDGATGRIALQGKWREALLERFNPLTGAINKFESPSFKLGPCESFVLVASLKNASTKDVETTSPTAKRIIDPSKMLNTGATLSIKAVDDNALPLDYMTVVLTDETIENEYFYRANQWFWNKKGFGKSPWDNGVQFKDELITKRFDDESSFDVIYRFEKSDDEISDLRFVVENPEMFNVFCNNRPVERVPNAWKFDRGFGVFDISKAVRAGVNEMKLTAPRATIFTELMPAFIVGSFSLEPIEHGYKIVAEKSLLPPANGVRRSSHVSTVIEGVAWLSSGVGFSQQDDRKPSLTFTFDAPTQIDAFNVWNYCEANLAKRGIKDFEIAVFNSEGDKVETTDSLNSSYSLGIGNTFAQRIDFSKPISLEKGWKLVLTIKSNWNGVEYPLADDFKGTTEPNNDNAFVGLSEIEFLARGENNELAPIQNKVSVSASSELVFRTHNRKASYIVDHSGLEETRVGWASLGSPFYPGAVDYSFELDLAEIPAEQRSVVDISSWNGAVAAVLVDGEQVGAIGWKGEEVDITDSLVAAQNAQQDKVILTVRVYGTPKNLFGPHHAGKIRGSAWPGNFHGAPKTQPNGLSYDVIEYGLFSE